MTRGKRAAKLCRPNWRGAVAGGKLGPHLTDISCGRSCPAADRRHGVRHRLGRLADRGLCRPGSFVGRLITTLGTSLGLNIEPTSTAAYLLGLAIIIGAIFALGVVVESGLRSFVLNSLDWLMRRIPIISNIYDLSKRFVAIVDRGDQGDLKSMSPVWCFFGGEGGAAVLGLMPSLSP